MGRTDDLDTRKTCCDRRRRADWQAWRKARKLEQQRGRRAGLRRIDYYPSKAAQAVIDARCGPFAGGDYSGVIDALVLAAGNLPE